MESNSRPGPVCRQPTEALIWLMALVAPTERLAAIADVLTEEKGWPGEGPLCETLHSAGIGVADPERDVLTVVDSIIRWARADRQKASIEELSLRWRLSIGGTQREVLEMALIDAAGCLVPDGVVRLHEGGPDRVVVQPRRIMELALRYGATGLVLAHNHPSGRVSPTRRDHDATRHVVLAASVLDIAVLDHLIVSREETFSFHREGLL